MKLKPSAVPNQNPMLLQRTSPGLFCASTLHNFALDRLSRYEARLWRQAGQILFALDALDRRKPQERSRLYVGGG